MNDLLTIFADILPKDDILKEIEKSISEYRIDPTPENTKKVTMYCVLWLSKNVSEEMGGVDKMLAHSEKVSKGFEFMKRMSDGI